MGFIFWMSTGAFSSERTSLVIGPLLSFFLPMLSTEETNIIQGVIRKLAHMSEYFILGMLLFRAFRGGVAGLSLGRCVLYSFSAAVLYAASDEYHQSFVSGRTASVADVLFDASGAFIAVGVSVVRQSRHVT
ncbi:MAG: VanZ family protein [Nitrospirae bacterium]|nr:VanZ family protein [Nitrospirota bacterium]